MISRIYTLVCLIIFGISDIRRRGVSLTVIIVAFLGVPIVRLCDWLVYHTTISISSSAMIVAMGVASALAAYYTRLMGVADCLTFMLIGLNNSIISTIATILLSLFLISACAMMLLITKRMRPKDELPFIPYMLVAYLGVLVCTSG